MASHDVSAHFRERRHVRAGVTLLYPWVIESKDNGTVTYSGLDKDLMDIISDALNFSYSLFLPPDRQFGDLHNGKWTGLMGMLERKEIDMVAIRMKLTPERIQVASWTSPTHYDFETVAVRKIQHTQGQWAAFVNPLSWQVYLCLLSVLLCCPCVLHLVTRLQHKLSPRSDRASVSDCAEYLTGSLFQEAMPHAWIETPSRVFVACWCFASLLVASSYTSQLTSLFVKVTSSSPFGTLEEMVQQDTFKWGTMGGTAHITALRNASNPTLQAVYQGLMTFAKEDSDVLHVEEHVHLTKMRGENYAYMADFTTLKRLAGTHCEIAVLEDKIFGMDSYVLYTQKNFSLRKDLDKVILNLTETGVLTYLASKWFHQSSVCDENQSSTCVITLELLQGPFYVIAGGLVVALGVLLLERGLGKRKVGRFRICRLSSKLTE